MIQQKAEVIGEKLVPQPLCRQQISHRKTWNRIRGFRGESLVSNRVNRVAAFKG